MGKLRNILLLSCLTLLPVRAERVGLVMSGGGAKGVAHIGLIQALEDNGIPIDYITGTSIGAVVGGLYAMGYSPAEMMELIKSKEFFNWMNGTVENEYIDFFRMPNPTPEIINASINLRDTTFNTGKILPTSLVNPIQMNFAFLQLTAQYTAQCQGDFNQLFVPFRSVAADVNNRRPYIFRMGDVGDAIRSSMTFPLVFKAIKVDGELLYDGGIYNNYPVDIMQSDFDPEHIIGSVVADLPKRPDDYDMVAQVQNMIMHPSNYQLPEDIGIQIQYDLEEISLLDFHKADSLYRIGYEGAMQQMDSIKQRISRRVDPFTLNLKRYIFKSQTPPLKFRKRTINGATEIQRDYILKVLKQDGNSLFDLEDFKVGYFKLLSDK
ncbi:MAG: patatin-like phospholipase family protein, partial [Bacteroidales bacterium]|nr:patatin-like phospholipase family protein [Bacteroidales bacterium]